MYASMVLSFGFFISMLAFVTFFHSSDSITHFDILSIVFIRSESMVKVRSISLLLQIFFGISFVHSLRVFFWFLQ